MGGDAGPLTGPSGGSAARVSIGGVAVGEGTGLAVIAGPCVIESDDLTLRTADFLAAMARRLGIGLVFKSSYDKANRTSLSSFRGPGLERGLRILERVRNETGLPVISDVHGPSEARSAGEVLDALQIPAFLCRQTDLLVAAARTGKAVNVKKGQFLAPADVGPLVEKLVSSGNDQVLITERGSSFGYRNLVVDMRALSLIRDLGVPVVFDATHAVQIPGGMGGSSGGERRFAPLLARAAVAAGCDAVFMEVHPRPDEALCDGPNMIPLSEVEDLLKSLLRIREAADGAGA